MRSQEAGRAGEPVWLAQPSFGETAPGENEDASRPEELAAPEPDTIPSETAHAEENDALAGETPDVAYTEMHQRRRKSLLSDCSRVKLFDFHTLAMANWPDNLRLAKARSHRDRWLFTMSLLAAVFLASLGNFAPAWAGGIAFGAFALSGFLLLPGVHRLFTQRASYRELLVERRQILRTARQHVQALENSTGLAWQCQPLQDYNPALRQARFQKLFRFSRDGSLLDHVRSRAHVRLYLMFLLEAERAYDAMEQCYFDAENEARVKREESDEGATGLPG